MLLCNLNYTLRPINQPCSANKRPLLARGVFFSLTLFLNFARRFKALVIQPSGPGICSGKTLFPPKSLVVGSALKGSASMVDHDLNNLKLGTLVKLKGGLRVWEYRGMQNGKVPLRLPASVLTILVKEEEVDWGSIQEK